MAGGFPVPRQLGVLLLTILVVVIATAIVVNLLEHQYISIDECKKKSGYVCKLNEKCDGRNLGIIKEGSELMVCCSGECLT